MVYNRKRTIGIDECTVYQLIEACLKLDLDYKTAIEAINVVLKKHKNLFNKNNKTVRIKKMDYRNYRRYITELKKMSPVHAIELETENDNNNNSKEIENPFVDSKKVKSIELAQLENLLFLLNDDNNDIAYKKHIKIDADNLIIKALIYLDKKYVF